LRNFHGDDAPGLDVSENVLRALLYGVVGGFVVAAGVSPQ
jgi:hypothetical protein